MTATRGDDALMQVLRKTILALVRRDEADLTSRQFGVFLTVYLTAGPHTVRGLAAELNASKPAITRALDRLGELSLARRKVPNGSPQRACAADSRGECVPGRPAPRHGGGGHGASHRGGVSTRGAAPDRCTTADCSAISRHEAGSVLALPFWAATAPPSRQGRAGTPGLPKCLSASTEPPGCRERHTARPPAMVGEVLGHNSTMTCDFSKSARVRCNTASCCVALISALLRNISLPYLNA
jgi:hypothetical protein